MQPAALLCSVSSCLSNGCLTVLLRVYDIEAQLRLFIPTHSSFRYQMMHFDQVNGSRSPKVAVGMLLSTSQIVICFAQASCTDDRLDLISTLHTSFPALPGIYFLTLPQILHTLQEAVQGACTPCWHFISGRINRARTV